MHGGKEPEHWNPATDEAGDANYPDAATANTMQPNATESS